MEGRKRRRLSVKRRRMRIGKKRWGGEGLGGEGPVKKCSSTRLS